MAVTLEQRSIEFSLLSSPGCAKIGHVCLSSIIVVRDGVAAGVSACLLPFIVALKAAVVSTAARVLTRQLWLLYGGLGPLAIAMFVFLFIRWEGGAMLS